LLGGDKTKILITPRSFASITTEPLEILTMEGYDIHSNETGEIYSEEQMIDLIRDAKGVIVGTDPLNSRVLSQADDLKIISKYGVGTDNIDLNYAAKNNITVTNTPEANSSSVAELVIAFIFALSRKIVEADQKAKGGYRGKIIGNLVRDKKLGILGLGKIGKKIALSARGLGMDVLAYDINRDLNFASKYEIEYVDFPRLITISDFITCHLPLNSRTKNLLSMKEFCQMKNSVYLINTSREGILNEKDLISSLLNYSIAGCALDVYGDKIIEAIEKNPELDERIILSPHMGAHTEEAIIRMGVESAQNIVNYFKGKRMANRVV